MIPSPTLTGVKARLEEDYGSLEALKQLHRIITQREISEQELRFESWELFELLCRTVGDPDAERSRLASAILLLIAERGNEKELILGIRCQLASLRAADSHMSHDDRASASQCDKEKYDLATLERISVIVKALHIIHTRQSKLRDDACELVTSCLQSIDTDLAIRASYASAQNLLLALRPFSMGIVGPICHEWIQLVLCKFPILFSKDKPASSTITCSFSRITLYDLEKGQFEHCFQRSIGVILEMLQSEGWQLAVDLLEDAIQHECYNTSTAMEELIPDLMLTTASSPEPALRSTLIRILRIIICRFDFPQLRDFFTDGLTAPCCINEPMRRAVLGDLFRPLLEDIHEQSLSRQIELKHLIQDMFNLIFLPPGDHPDADQILYAVTAASFAYLLLHLEANIHNDTSDEQYIEGIRVSCWSRSWTAWLRDMSLRTMTADMSGPRNLLQINLNLLDTVQFK